MRQFIPFLLLLLITCSACETDLMTGTTPADEAEILVPATDDGPAADALSQTALALINEVRANGCRCGGQRMPPVEPLTTNDRLTTAARQHSADQAALRNRQHVGSDGSNVGTRVTRAGYTWRGVAENVAWNYPTVEAAVEGWLSSTGHCKNIMNAAFTHMGIGVNNRYWTQVFARQ